MIKINYKINIKDNIITFYIVYKGLVHERKCTINDLYYKHNLTLALIDFIEDENYQYMAELDEIIKKLKGVL